MQKIKLTGFVAMTAAAMLALVVPIAQVSAATIEVDDKADDLTPGDGRCTLREAIINANYNLDTTAGDCVAGEASVDVIDVPAGEYTLSILGQGEDAAATGDLDITDSVFIAGAGANKTTINFPRASLVMSAVGGVFDIPPGAGGIDFAISGLTMSGFIPQQRAGRGIFNRANATVTVIGSIITGFDGGIHSRGGQLTVIGSTVDDNGGLFGIGGILSEDTDTTITNSMISNNTGDFDLGGGVSFAGETLMVTGSTFSGNTHKQGCGGMGIVFSLSTTITSSTFSNNEGDLSGAICVHSGEVTITQSKISGNQAFIGGGIFISPIDAEVTITNSTLSKNEAERDGGGILNDGMLNLTDTKFKNNEPNDCVDRFGEGCPD